jgi:hypothetical protein
MANNRMYIGCIICGEIQFIAKYYPTPGWEIWESACEPASKFLNEHAKCAPYNGLLGPMHYCLADEAIFEEGWQADKRGILEAFQKTLEAKVSTE